MKQCTAPSADDLLIDPDVDSFDIFRCSIFCLMSSSNNAAILKFTKNYPSEYDPAADIFIPCSAPD